jgi:predicted adenine nucleotide alpha hydrolase (AANH) superfamily ATPase
MNAVNYNEQLKKLVNENIKNGVKPKLLLHACCAPCSTTCIERLKDGFDISVFYYNPNIDDKEEYFIRIKEQKAYCEKVNVGFIEGEYDTEVFYNAVRGKEKLKEGGARCFICYELRLMETAKKAKELGYEYFATTLTLSPLKNATVLNETGFNIEKLQGVKYLASDFKKENGYLRSVELSKENNLYRQNYCGCSFSKAIDC